MKYVFNKNVFDVTEKQLNAIHTLNNVLYDAGGYAQANVGSSVDSKSFRSLLSKMLTSYDNAYYMEVQPIKMLQAQKDNERKRLLEKRKEDKIVKWVTANAKLLPGMKIKLKGTRDGAPRKVVSVDLNRGMILCEKLNTKEYTEHMLNKVREFYSDIFKRWIKIASTNY